MTDKHTPGPWRTAARTNNMIDVLHAVEAPGAITTALCRVQARPSWIAEAEANARLIAAAPALLMAARKALDECCDLVSTPAGDALDAAIALAVG